MRRTTVALLAFVAVTAALAAPAGANHSITQLISTGPAGGNANYDVATNTASPDGRTSYFVTRDRLLFEDDDVCPSGPVNHPCTDIYARHIPTGQLTLVSTGPNEPFAPDANVNYYFGSIKLSPDGSRVYFESFEALTSDDADSLKDWYVRDMTSGTVTLLTPDSNTSFLDESYFAGATADGSRVCFRHEDRLVPEDTDSSFDIYERDVAAGTWTRLSPGPGLGPFECRFHPGGTRTFWVTNAQLLPEDTDTRLDVYGRVDGAIRLISTGEVEVPSSLDEMRLHHTSADGTRVLFSTPTRFDSDDTNNWYDLYEWHDGTLRILTVDEGGVARGWEFGSFGGATADGSRVWFHTDQGLVAGDVDGIWDLYENDGATNRLVSTGPAETNTPIGGQFAAATADGSRVFFQWDDRLTADDLDTNDQDLYERSGGTTKLISTGPLDPHGNNSARFVGMNDDGSRVFFYFPVPLTPEDTDGQRDYYERMNGTTTLLTIGPNGGNGPIPAEGFVVARGDGKYAFIFTRESLLTQDSDSQYDFYARIVDDGYPRPGAGSPLRVPLVPAYAECDPDSANSSHVEPLDYPSCEPPALESQVLTTHRLGRGQGSARLDVRTGDPGTPEDEADLRLVASATDVRCSTAPLPGCAVADGDYTGSVLLSTRIRITDRRNGGPGTGAGAGSGTLEETRFEVPAVCVPTADTSRGSACTVNTTANTQIPGWAQEGRRAVISAFSVELRDAGPNGTGYGASCPPTCGDGDEATYLRQGVFIGL